MKDVGKTTRKHRRQQKAGKPRHKLIGGRTGKKASTQFKNGHRGKGARTDNRARHEVIEHRDNPPALSAKGFEV